MRTALYDTLLYGRFALAHTIITTSMLLTTAAIKLLPRDHPSRTYITGRLKITRSRLPSALRAPRR